MQAEECSHAGLKCNYFCRTCNVGGNIKYKESDEGYESLFHVRVLSHDLGVSSNIDYSLALPASLTTQLIKFKSSNVSLPYQVVRRRLRMQWQLQASRTRQLWPPSIMF